MMFTLLFSSIFWFISWAMLIILILSPMIAYQKMKDKKETKFSDIGPLFTKPFIGYILNEFLYRLALHFESTGVAL